MEGSGVGNYRMILIQAISSHDTRVWITENLTMMF